jgi:hypothetical protein
VPLLHDTDHVDQRNARRTAFEAVDRVGGVHPLGSYRFVPWYDWGEPARLAPRYEVFDHGARRWVGAPRAMVRQLQRLTQRQRELFLRVHSHGVRLAPEYDDAQALGDGLEEHLNQALACGHLDMGHRSYPVSMSPTGNIRVRSGDRTHTYTRAAMLDAMQRGGF